MILVILGHDFHYEMENLCRVFFPHEKIEVVYSENVNKQEITVITGLTRKANLTEIYIKAEIGQKERILIKTIDFPKGEENDECERVMAAALFNVLSDLTGYTPGWGILTGVRPAKLMSNLIKNYGEIEAVDYFKTKLLVSDEKTGIAVSVAKHEEKLIQRVNENLFSLYIAIPFCPSRCNYCSFVSHSISNQNAKKMVPKYIDNLCEEIRITGNIALELETMPQTIYFGGGTPTSLDENDLERLFDQIKKSFILSEVEEYTVEAGRPDTITTQKLSILRDNGVSRISINPQSFNDSVLEKAGRRHTAQEAVDAYKRARNAGFNNINMDLIAGLPDDTAASFARTLDLTSDLGPENITIHTLALKRSASLSANGFNALNSECVSEMLISAKEKLTNKSYSPYYMYRQSLSLGNHENIGWCKGGFEGLYNVIMMEECQTVLAVGAGGVTKLKQSNGSHIERIFNFKYPYEYNNRFNEIIDRKSKITEFYKKYC